MTEEGDSGGKAGALLSGAKEGLCYQRAASFLPHAKIHTEAPAIITPRHSIECERLPIHPFYFPLDQAQSDPRICCESTGNELVLFFIQYGHGIVPQPLTFLPIFTAEYHAGPTLVILVCGDEGHLILN